MGFTQIFSHARAEISNTHIYNTISVVVVSVYTRDDITDSIVSFPFSFPLKLSNVSGFTGSLERKEAHKCVVN